MLTEDEIKAEIELLNVKIKKFEAQVKPFLELESLIQGRLNELHSGININVAIQQKSAKEAMIKNWKKELQIYQRILSGKKMDPLAGEDNADKTGQLIRQVISEVKEINN